MFKILTEGSSSFGFGHMVRCFSLVEFSCKNDIPFSVFIDGDETSKMFIKENGAQQVNWKNKQWIEENLNINDTVVIDSYHINLEMYEFIKKRVKKLVIIDDVKRLNFKNSIILNPNFSGEIIDYDESNTVYTGCEYTMVRESFINKKYQDNKQKEILITFGGSDILKLTPKVLEYLTKNFSEYKINCVIGKGYLQKDFSNYSKNVEFHIDVSASKMCELMLSAYFVISAAGQTVNELLRLGVPSAIIKVIDNQQLNIDYLSSNDYALIFNKDELDTILEMKEIITRENIINKIGKFDNEFSGVEKIFQDIILKN